MTSAKCAILQRAQCSGNYDNPYGTLTILFICFLNVSFRFSSVPLEYYHVIKYQIVPLICKIVLEYLSYNLITYCSKQRKVPFTASKTQHQYFHCNHVYSKSLRALRTVLPEAVYWWGNFLLFPWENHQRNGFVAYSYTSKEIVSNWYIFCLH